MMLRTRPVVVLAALAAAGIALAQQSIQRDGFDGKEPQWARGQANVPFAEEAHLLTNQHAHSLPTSEYIRIKADANGGLNPFVHYTYATSPAPVVDDMTCRAWVRASRPGVQLFARVVLPRERDAARPTEPMTVLLRGEAYKTSEGFWQPLELRRPAKQLKDEQQVLRTKLQRDVNIDGAFIDHVVLNLYTGPGATEVWVDDLEIGPVIQPPAKGQAPGMTTSRTTAPAIPPTGVTAVPPPSTARPPQGARVAVEFNRENLYVGGRKYLMRAVRYSDTPLKVLRDAGLNTLFIGDKMDPGVYEQAVREGFWLVPSLPPGTPDPEAVTRDVGRFAADDAVLFWYLGADAHSGQFASVARTVHAVRTADPNRPLALDAWDGLPLYSRQVDLLAAHRFPLMTSLELPQYRDWLNSRRQLDRFGSYFWTWVQTHITDPMMAVVYPEVANGHFDEPVGPQPEQIRLLTYLALSAGCKGLGFWSDQFLADSHQGRDRLLTLALLNQELQMLEPLLLGVVDTPVWIDTSVPEVKAAVLRCDRGVLVLPMWLGKGAQHVPGQAASAGLTLTVPMVPTGAAAWVVSPGEVKALAPPKRVVGGSKIEMTEFDVTAAIVFTSDNSPTGLLVRWQDQCRRMQKLAAQWTYDLAKTEIEKVEKVQVQLRDLGREPADGKTLLAKSGQYMADSKAAWEANDFAKAYHDAQRAMRPLRILMRAEWEEAAKSLGPDAPPTASPFATSFYTLPKHWRFRHVLEESSPGGNKLVDGDFEAGDTVAGGWREQRLTAEEVEGDVRLTGGVPGEAGSGPHGGRRCLMIQVRPKMVPGQNGAAPAPAVINALEPTYVAVTSPPVQLPPGSLVRVSGWVKVPKPIEASADGALVFDTSGGEPLGVRLTSATKGWQRFTLFRRVPPNGVVQVTAALTGVGTAYFDDLAIEPLNSK